MKKIIQVLISSILILASFFIIPIDFFVNVNALRPMDYKQFSEKEVHEFVSNNDSKMNIYTIDEESRFRLLESSESVTGESSPSKSIVLRNDTVQKIGFDGLNELKENFEYDYVNGIIVGNDQLPELLLDSNIDYIKSALKKGYSLYFETSDPYERDQVYQKLGILDSLEDYGNYEQDEMQLIGAYVIFGMSGDVYTGSLYSNEKSTLVETLILEDLVKTRNFKNYYKIINGVSKKSNSSLLALNVNAYDVYSSPIWDYNYSYEVRSSYTYIINSVVTSAITSYTSYGWTTHTSSDQHYYIVFTRMFAEPKVSNNFYYSKYIDFKLIVDQFCSGCHLTQYAPTLPPSSSTYTFTVGASINKEGVSGAVSFAWQVVQNDLTVTNPNASMYNDIANSRFNYPMTWGFIPTAYSQAITEQQASAIFRDDNKAGYAKVRPYFEYKISDGLTTYTIVSSSSTIKTISRN